MGVKVRVPSSFVGHKSRYKDDFDWATEWLLPRLAVVALVVGYFVVLYQAANGQ
jgi:hypothetical protein